MTRQQRLSLLAVLRRHASTMVLLLVGHGGGRPGMASNRRSSMASGGIPRPHDPRHHNRASGRSCLTSKLAQVGGSDACSPSRHYIG
jgi:hypothetical protein